MSTTLYDTLGNGVQVGTVLQGFGLNNAGRYYTVLTIGKTRGRVSLERHLDGKVFWTYLNSYGVITD